jgi:NTE family protein
MKTPDVLVLGAGGILGEAWTSSLLAGLGEGDGFDARGCQTYIGTSAGSIVAAMLCAGVDPASRLGEFPEPPSVEQAEEVSFGPLTRLLRLGASAGTAATGPLASIFLHTTVPGGRLLRRAALSRVRRGRISLAELGAEVERSGADWDGRLMISTVELESGRRVIFDGSDPAVSVPDAVQASCAIPGVFRPINANGRSYVDGGAWSTTNLDVAPVEKGTEVLCLNPTGSLRGRRGLLSLLGPISRSQAAIEAAALRQRGARVKVVAPDGESVAAMGPNLMRRTPRPAVIAAGLAQGRTLAAGVG